MASTSDISPATQAVLFNSDLQVKIFETLDDETVVHCALVCKAWTENALDHAWRTVTSFRQLCNVLAPLTPHWKDRDNGFDFSRLIQAKDMLRLSYYSKRVRCLQLCSVGIHCNREHLPCESAFYELLLYSHGPSILPNPVEISLEGGVGSTRFIVPFLHPDLEDLDLSRMDNESWAELLVFLEELGPRSPRLRKLFLDVPEDSTVALERVSQFVSKQTSLEELGTLPLSLLSTLSRLPKLNFLALSSIEADNSQATTCVPCRSGVCFPSLRRLSLNTTFSNAADFISSHSSLSKLTEIKLDARRADDSNTVEDFHRLFAVVSNLCAYLEVLDLEAASPVVQPLTCKELDPIASCRRLRVFSLRVAQLELDSEELVDLLARFPRLEVLSLESYSDAYPHALTPFMLHRIAKVQPDLHRLSLRLIEGSAVTDQLFPDTIVPFRRLEELQVGLCRVTDADRLALYFIQILPSKCKISTRYDGDDDDDDDDDDEKQWDIVRSRIPFFAAIISQQRRKLQGELDALQQKLASCRCKATENGKGR